MATLNTRISLKYDTLENWNSNNPVLLAGEIGIATVPDAVDPIHNAPAIVFKVGDGTSQWTALNYGSALAADVYAWAKAATKPTYSYGELTGTPTIGNGTITISQGGETKGTFTLNQEGNATIELDAPNEDTNTKYQLVITDHTLTLQSSETGSAPWTEVSKITLPDNNTTYTFAEGSVNGAFSVTPSNGEAQSVPVHGLGSAAYTESSAYATAAQGGLADTAVQPEDLGDLATQDTVTDAYVADGALSQSKINGLAGALAAKADLAGANFTGAITVQTPTENNNPTTKAYVDSAIAGITEFNFSVVEELPQTGEAGTIYLVAHEHGAQDGYDEYIWVNDGFEKIGNTDIDLSDYATIAMVDALFSSLPASIVASNVITGFTYDSGTHKLTVTTAPIAITMDQVTNAGALATLNAVGDAQITDVAMAKVTGLQAALDAKQDDLTFNGEYSTSNPVATVSTVTSAIGALDNNDAAVANQYVTAVSETDGVVSVTRKQISYNELSDTPAATNYVAGDGLTVSNAEGTVTYGVDTSEVWVFNCGTSSTNI